MRRRTWLTIGLALAVTYSVCGTGAFAQDSNAGTSAPNPNGNWLYNQTKQQILDAEKKAQDQQNPDQSSNGDQSGNNSSAGNGGGSGGGGGDGSGTNTSQSGGDKKDGDKKADADKKDGDKKDGDKKDGDKKADSDKKDDDKKADADKKDRDKKDSDKKADSDKKDDDKKADADKREEEKKAEAEKREEDKKLTEKPLPYDPLKDAMFDLNAQKYDDGIATLKKLLSAQPKNIRAHYILAVTYVMKRLYPLAIEQYKLVLQLAPDINSGIGKLAADGLKKIQH